MSSDLSTSIFRFLDQCLQDRTTLEAVKSVILKIDKCVSAVENKMNLAEVLEDKTNQKALADIAGEQNLSIIYQTILKLALSGYESKSFSVLKDIHGAKELDFLYRSVGGWAQFDTVLVLLFPENFSPVPIATLNPLKQEQWKKIEIIPAGTLVSVYLKGTREKREHSQEVLALERYQLIFDSVQHLSEFNKGEPAPVIQLHTGQEEAEKKPAKQGPPATQPKRIQSTTVKNSIQSLKKGAWGGGSTLNQAPVTSLRVVVNKIDTFVHAGNAQLIMAHIKNYPGNIKMFVLRDKKQEIHLNPDSIWSAEVRNGETILFEFFGPQPTQDFAKDLAKSVNKYTQMDKIME